MIADGGRKTVAGCVAIAASQIVYYWHRDNPSHTSFATPVYPYGPAPVTYSVPAGTDLQWNLIRDSYYGYESEEECHAVAQLVYVVGTSSWLKYGVSTGGQISEVMPALYSQFRLDSQHAIKKRFTQQEWEDLLYGELASGRPILYAGDNPASGGHAVVVDGYDAATNRFHFNFGWGGSGDGYFTVDDETGMNGYCSSQECVYGIKPLIRNIQVTVDGTDHVARDESHEFILRLCNNSTLPLQGLRVYLTKTSQFMTIFEKPVFSTSDIIPNNGQELLIPFTAVPRIEGEACVMTITDGLGSNLGSTVVSIDRNTGVMATTTDTPLTVTTIPGGLCLTATQPTRVTLYSATGMACRCITVSRTATAMLPAGMYIVDGKKYLVK